MTDISVVVRTHIRPELLDRALTSLRGQTHATFEALVIDDAGTLEARRIVGRYDSRFVYLRNRRKQGPAGAANEGILAASAPIVLFLDDDDEAAPTLLARTLEAHRTADFTWCGIRRVVNGVEVERRTWTPDDAESAYLTFLHHRLIGIAMGGAISRQLIDRGGLFDEDLREGADGEYIARLLRLRPRLHAIAEPLLTYHATEGVDTLSKSANSRRVLAHERIMDLHADTLAAHPDVAAKVYAGLAAQHYLLGDRRAARRAVLRGIRSAPWVGRSWKVAVFYEFGLKRR